jgi:hypothetical protein
MRRITLDIVGACCSFSVYYALLDTVYMRHLTVNLPATFITETAYVRFSVHLPIRLPFCLSVRPSVHLPVCPSA